VDTEAFHPYAGQKQKRRAIRQSGKGGNMKNKKDKFFFRRKSLLDNNGRKEESGGDYLFYKKNKKTGKGSFVTVSVNPRYTITDVNKHKYRFDKKRNVNKVLRKFGIKDPTRQCSFNWSNDASFESGNGKVTKKGYALLRTQDDGKSFGWLYPDGSFEPKKETRKSKAKGGK
jgi:hypothetical protein